MRRAIAIAALVAANAHAADCDAQMQTIFADLETAASRIVERQGKAMRPALLEAAQLTPFIARVGWISGTFRMQYSVSLCDQPFELRQGTIAHEFGHLLQFALQSKADELRLARYGVWLRSQAEHEHAANYYGAQVLREANVDSAPYLARLDAACAAGSNYECRAAESWRIGLTW